MYNSCTDALLCYNGVPVDPPRKRIDSVPLTPVNGMPHLSLGSLSEGSPLIPRRGLSVQQM